MFLAYILWVGVTVASCVWLARRGGKRSRARSIACASLGAGLILLPYWDLIFGIPTMREICSEEAGLQVHDNVQFPLSSVEVRSDTPKSLCLSCFAILARGLAFETRATITLIHDSPRSALVDESGLVRYWLSTHGDPSCAAFAREYPSAAGLWRTVGATYDGRSCIASEILSNPLPAAEFEFTAPAVTIARRGAASVRSRRIELRRTDGGEVVASLAHFAQLPWYTSITAGVSGLLPLPPSCPSFIHPITRNNFAPEHLMELLSGQREHGEILK